MNRRALRLALTALSATALALGGATAASAAAGPGEISVTLLASDTHAPIVGGCVSVYDADGFGPLASACGADAAGVITVGGLTDGTSYKVFVDGNENYLGEWLFGLDDSFDAALITAPADVTAPLRVGVPASGTLTRTDGTPAADIGVRFDDATTGNGGFSATTGPDGTWSALVPPGSYKVQFFDPVLGQYYAVGKQDFTTADVITVTAGTPLLLDDVLPLPGTAAGRIVDAAGAGIAGLCVAVSPPDDPTGGVGTGCATTSATGRYRIPQLRPGRYVVVATDPAANWAAVFSRPFTVNGGATTFVPPQTAARGGTLTGILVDAATRTPLKGICPSAFPAATNGFYVGTLGTCTGATGRFRIRGLPAGRTVVQLPGDARHPLVWAPLAPTRALATKYLITAGQNTALGTIAEPLGGNLAGRITGPDGAGLPGVFVSLDGHPGRAGAGEGQNDAFTDANGNYIIRNLPKWNAPVVVYPDVQPLGVRWSGNATDPAQATPVAIGWNRRTTFNLQLQPEAKLAVTVTGAPAGESILVDPVGSNGATMGFGGDLAADGTTTLGQLPGGGVRLRITMFPSNRVFYYDGATSAATATVVPTTAGATTSVTVAVPPA